MTEDYLEPCPDDHFYCQSRMAVDWFAAGDQTIIFERSCAKTEVIPEEQCFEGGNAIDQPLFKDCKITCDSDNCNNEESTEDVEVKYRYIRVSAGIFETVTTNSVVYMGLELTYDAILSDMTRLNSEWNLNMRISDCTSKII